MKISIPYPEGVKILVRDNQHVNFSSPFYTNKTPHKTIIPLAETLKFQPERIFIALKKVIGDRIRKGELLAEHKAFFSTKHYIANVDGILVDIDHTKGSITIQLDTESDQTVPCYFDGIITSISDDHIELEVGNARMCELVESAPSALGGAVYYLGTGAELSDEAIENHIIVAANIDPLTAIKLSTFGAKCVVTNSKKSIPDGIRMCYLAHPDDFSHVIQTRYPFCVTAHDRSQLYFYS